jgi:tRNA(fMet)-specific endonuclease VapC
MLDTNMCIYIIKKKPQQVLERLKGTRISEIGVSAITLSELAYGAEKSSRPDQNKIAMAEFLAPLEILSYDDMAAQQYGKIRSYLEGHGTPIGPMDMLIAAHSLSLNCTLVTNNEREFRRIPWLKIENWAG